MKYIGLTSALLVSLAFPALASSQHEQQLEKSIGVQHGDFSLAELARIKGSYDSDTGYNIPQSHQGESATSSFNNNDAKEQLAASIGVDPQYYTLSELAAIKGTFDSDTGYRIPSKDNSVVSTQSNHNGAAKKQLAAQLGVNAEDFTLSELAMIKGSFDSDNGYNMPPRNTKNF